MEVVVPKRDKIVSLPTKKSKSPKKKIKRKVAKVLNHGLGKNYLTSWNPYLQTILDPFHVTGIRVPDLITTPSGTFSIKDMRTLTVNANGICGLLYGMGIAGNFPNYTPCGGLSPWNSGLAIPGSYNVGINIGVNSTAAILLQAGSSNIALSKFNSTSSSVATLYSSVRLVSFGATIQYTGSALTAKGSIIATSEPRETYGYSNKVAGATLTLDDMKALRSAVEVSVPLEGGATAVYFPQDSMSTNYYSTTTNYTLSQFPRSVLGGEVGLIVNGATPGDTFAVTAIWNFEGVPFTNQLDLVSTSPSKSDPLAMSHAANTISDTKPIISQPISMAQDGKAQVTKDESQSINHHKAEVAQPTMFENFVGMLDKVPSVVSKGMAIAESLSPLLTALL